MSIDIRLLEKVYDERG